MSDPTGGDLSPGTAPSATPSTPPAAPAYHPPAPAVRRPQAENPNVTRVRKPHWSEATSAEAAYRRNYERLAGGPDAAAPPTADTGTPPAPPAPTDPASGDKFKFGDFELTAAEIKELAAFKATDDSRRLTLPKTPEEYEVRLPKNYQIPQGIEYTINPDDPIVPHARDFALKAGLSKDQFEQLVGLYAQAEIGRQQRYQAAAKDEILKLGPNASTRVTVVQTFLKAQLGDELARQFFFTTMGSARNVEAMEKLMSNFASQGGGSYSAAHQTAPESGDVIPGYDRMNFVQRRAAQDALAARRAGRR